MRFRLLGDWWRFSAQPEVIHDSGEAVRGQCDRDGRSIEVESGLREQEALEVTLHELMHATNWLAGEKVVTEAAKDMSRLLWRLGWRRSG